MSTLPQNIKTQRLDLRPISKEDDLFMFQLVNTDGWKKFIADMNIQTIEKANLYIQRVLEAPNTFYWTVVTRESNQKIGILTFLKRPSLDHFDLGFAFLPEHLRKGYATEACMVFMDVLKTIPKLKNIQAVTNIENIASIRLLEKLNFTLQEKQNEKDKDSLVFLYRHQ